MKRKHLLLILVCLAVMLLAGYATLRLTAPNHRITRKNLKAIEFGMAEREVEEIFGVPAGDYSAKKGGSVGYGENSGKEGRELYSSHLPRQGPEGQVLDR